MPLVRRICLAAAALSLICSTSAPSATASPQSEDEAQQEPLAAELLEAETVCLMDSGVMDPDLKSRFRGELEDWARFELVMFPDEADVLMSLSARSDFTSRPVDEKDCDPDDPLCERAEGTAQIFEMLYLKVFVQGGDDLWIDEEQVGEDDSAAQRLVDRLRSRLEESPQGENRESAGAEGAGS